MKTAAIIQARMTSTRLPGKALIDLHGKPALQRVIERLRASKVDDVIVATTTNKDDDPITSLCESLGCNYFRGSEDDVLSRVLGAAKQFGVDVIVEITADCPLIDWNHVNMLLTLHGEGTAVDMTSNIIERTFPRGYDIRVFNTKALERADKDATCPVDRQHVSTVMYLNPKTKGNYLCLNWSAPLEQNRPGIEVTLDTPEDLELIRWLFSFESQGYNLELTCEQVISLIDTYPMMYEKVSKIQRKNYFDELEEAYKPPKAEGAKKQDEKVPNNNNRVRQARSGRGAGAKRKNN